MALQTIPNVAVALRQRLLPPGLRTHRCERNALRPRVESSAAAVALLTDLDRHGIWFVDADGQRIDPRRVAVAPDGTTAIDTGGSAYRPALFTLHSVAVAEHAAVKDASRLRQVLRMLTGHALLLDFKPVNQESSALVETARSAKLRQPPAFGSGRRLVLFEAERVLRKHSPATFEVRRDAYGECIEDVRGVEDIEAWKDAYDSLDQFYAAHEGRHPHIRRYANARRDRQSWKTVLAA